MRRSVLRSSAAPSSRTAARSSFVSLVSISSALGALALLPFSGLAGCSSSGSTSDDGGTGASDGSTQVGDGSSTSDAGVSDGSATADGDTEGAVVLVNNGDYTTSSGEVVALDPISGTTLGRLAYGSGDGALASTSRAPFLLERDKDVVHELDPRTPWISRGTWNVRGDDRPDGGLASANPRGVVFTTGTRDYVVRFNRNRIARIEGSGADAAAPTAFVDLASYASAADADGVVEPTDGFFDPTSNRLFVLLGRIDLTKVASDGFSILCTASKPVLVAIDTTTDALVNLGGSGTGGAIELKGYNPTGLAYDAATKKVHVLHAGCNQPGGDGGAGALDFRGIETVDLAAKTSAISVDARDKGFPGSFAIVDATTAVASFGGTAYVWNRSGSAFDRTLVTNLGGFASDGAGHLYGVAVRDPNATKPVYDVVRVAVKDGTKETVAENPFTLTNGFPLDVVVWTTK